MNQPQQYAELIKPFWAPPSWVFGPVWTVLYAIIAISFGTVFYKVATKELPFMVALPFALNLLFNFSFTYIQFGLVNNALASIDILLVLGTLIWGLSLLWSGFPELRWIVYANVPYALWVAFASTIQLSITYLNWN